MYTLAIMYLSFVGVLCTIAALNYLDKDTHNGDE